MSAMPARTMKLRDLLAGSGALTPIPDVEIRGLSQDSRAVRAHDAYFALAGANAHGLRFADAALAAGASAIVFDAPVPTDVCVPEGAIAVPGLRGKLGVIADRFYDAPSRALTVTGVTGTNGKTSFVQLLTQALALNGHVAGSIGTLGAGLFGQIIAGERTTPDVLAVHRLLADMRAHGASHVAMEVSSHALDQGRVDAVAFAVAVFTNLTRDHLDYHGTMAAYGAAKAKLLAWPGLRAAVVNLDDPFGVELFAGLPESLRGISVSSRGGEVATVRAQAIVLDARGIGFDLVMGQARARIQSPLLGRFNVDNLLAVAGTLHALDWSFPAIAAALPKLQPVHGRMNRLGGDSGLPLVVVDYAHTPDALEQALTSLRAHTAGRLICVFGCGGERDQGKRSAMGEIASRLADWAVITDDNPRGEDGDAIVAAILAGFDGLHAQIERDRAAAIAMAVAGGKAGDVVLIAGKGHEPYQDVAGVRRPFDDLEHARAALGAHP